MLSFLNIKIEGQVFSFKRVCYAHVDLSHDL